MESNKIAILDKKLPLRAYPENDLNTVLQTSFKYWLATLLSIKADNEEKLDNALPAIKKHFWSLGLNEIKKAFEMYADGELITKPIPNYFDRILVGQIFKEYKQQKPIIKKVPKTTINEEEKVMHVRNGMIKCFKEYEEKEIILDGYVMFLYDIFYEDGYLPKDKKSKNKAYNDAKLALEIQAQQKPNSLNEHYKIKDLKKSLLQNISHKVVRKAKEMIVSKFLRETYRNEESVKALKNKYITP